MTQKERAAMQQALKALEELFHSNSTKVAVEKYNTAHKSLQEALAEQAEQEPVAWFVQYKNRHEFVFGSKPEFIVDGVVEPLYAAPVRTKDLTDDEIREIEMSVEPFAIDLARAVIAADREKNNV